ncbi:MAG: DUF6672 family protein [Spirochaetales bacterium]|jgi:hypothetical protein
MKAISFRNRSFVVRSILVLVYIAVIVIMLMTGKRHTILIDNKDSEDGSILAIDGMSIQIDNQEASEYYPGDRDKAVVQGQRHKVRVEILADGKIVETAFRVPLNQDMVLLEVPKLLAGVEPYLRPFTVLQEQASAPAVDTPQSIQFGGDAVVPPDGSPDAPPAPVLVQ